jgi:hypothetical protein
MASRKERERQRKYPVSFDGGFQNVLQFLGLRDTTYCDNCLDVVFVCIDFEASRRDTGEGVPPVAQFGIATLNTRVVKSEAPPCPATKSISTQQFSTSHASKDFFDCDSTDFKECVFAETHFVSRNNLAITFAKSLRIQDTTSSDPKALRKIALVGHSTMSDIIYLERLGVDLYESASVLEIFDTHSMSKLVFGRGFTVGALLGQLECPCEASDFHNAGNDATYTLHAMLMLAIKGSESREMSLPENESLEHLRALVQNELHQYPRWKPPRRPVGFYALETLS